MDAAAASRASSWQTTLWLPVDASFVGLRGPVELERAIAAITITPIAVVDAGARPLVPIVLAAGELRGRDVVLSRRAALSGTERLLDASAAQSSHVTVAVPPGHTAPVVLRMHPGAMANNVTVSTFGWQRRFDDGARPGGRSRAAARSPSGVVPLTIAADTGFYPQDVDPKSTDRRFLGIWVEVTNRTTPTP